jgi:hypothetical protein
MAQPLLHNTLIPQLLALDKEAEAQGQAYPVQILKEAHRWVITVVTVGMRRPAPPKPRVPKAVEVPPSLPQSGTEAL